MRVHHTQFILQVVRERYDFVNIFSLALQVVAPPIHDTNFGLDPQARVIGFVCTVGSRTFFVRAIKYSIHWQINQFNAFVRALFKFCLWPFGFDKGFHLLPDVPIGEEHFSCSIVFVFNMLFSVRANGSALRSAFPVVLGAELCRRLDGFNVVQFPPFEDLHTESIFKGWWDVGFDNWIVGGKD